MTDLTINPKKFNLPSYINIPHFLYQDNRLDKAASLIASFFYSIHTSGNDITASVDYLCLLASVNKRQYYNIMNQLEESKYIKRTGFTNRTKTNWIYAPKSTVTIVELETNATQCTTVEDLNTSAIECSKLVHSSAVNLCTPVHTYNKDDIKVDKNTTTSSMFNFEEYKQEEKTALNDSLIANNESQLKEKFKTEALTDTACNETFKSRFTGIEVTLIQLYEECCDYWSQKNQMVYKARFLTHLKKTPIDKYKTGSSASKYPTKEQRDAEYKKIEQREKESEQRRQQDIDRSAKLKNIDKRKEITQTASSALSSCLNALRQ